MPVAAGEPQPSRSATPETDRSAAAGRGGFRPRWFRRKEWDDHVHDLEELASSAGFSGLRDRIVALAEPRSSDQVVDVGSGTGLLALALAPAVDKVWAIDISPAMCRHLRQKLQRQRIENVDVVISSAVTLPLADESVDVVVSNYCYHHLSDTDKDQALAEVRRVLRPGGRLVIGDMMFRVGLTSDRDRQIIVAKVASMLRRGPAGVMRLARHVFRYLAGRWEHPADVTWWEAALARAGFTAVGVELLDHEGGIAVARRP